MTAFPDALKAARAAADLTQVEVADQLAAFGGLKVTPQAVSEWENAKSKPGPVNAKALERMLDQAGVFSELLGYSPAVEVTQRLDALEDEVAAIKQQNAELLALLRSLREA